MTLTRWPRCAVTAALASLSICASAAEASAEGPALQFAGPSVEVAAVVGPTVIGSVLYSPVQTTTGGASSNGATIVGSTVIGPGAAGAAASQDQFGAGVPVL